MDCLTVEDGTDTLPRYVGGSVTIYLPAYTEQLPRRWKTSQHLRWSLKAHSFETCIHYGGSERRANVCLNFLCVCF